MYTIISGTNRPNSHTEKIAAEYHRFLKEKGIEANIFSLQNFDTSKKTPEFSQAETGLLIPAQKIIFIIPEYNGSFPGILKAMIDMSDIKKTWWWKKALLTGVSTGRAGNLRGMDHLAGILNYMMMIVHPNKLPISVIDTVMDVNGTINNKSTLLAIHQQIDEFIKF